MSFEKKRSYWGRNFSHSGPKDIITQTDDFRTKSAGVRKDFFRTEAEFEFRTQDEEENSNSGRSPI